MRKPIDTADDCLRDLANSSVAICGLARNCGSKLKSNIRFIENLSAYFKETVIIVVENDSKDATRSQLNQWVFANRNVTILDGLVPSHGTGINESIRISANPYYSRARISRMACLRNQYLEHLAGLNRPIDYLLVMDFDVDQISLKGVLASFSRNKEWDVVTAYGYSLSPKLQDRYHDTYALVPLGEEQKVQTEKSIKELQNKWRMDKSGKVFKSVYAAYGGLSIYKYELVKNIRYQVLRNEDERVEVRCEHFSVCDQLQKMGQKMIMVNPQMHLRYQTIWDVLYRILSWVVLTR